MMARRTESACQFFCRYPQLTELKLFNWKDASHLLMAVGQHCPQLQHLTVRYSRIRFVKDLLAVAQGCPRLRTLDLEAQQHLLDLFFYSVTRKVVNLYNRCRQEYMMTEVDRNRDRSENLIKYVHW